MERVNGIGGVFFRSTDPAATVAWYQQHLGIDPAVDFAGANFVASSGEATVWSAFDEDTDYFGRSGQRVMINYRVDDLAAMLHQLRAAGVEVDDAEEHGQFGSFAWAVDGDGNRFELWQPPTGGYPANPAQTG